MTKMTKADVAVVISTYNRPRALDLVLEGLAYQDVAPRQILVADDGSGPETAEVIKTWVVKGLPISHYWQEDQGYRKTIIMNRALRDVTAHRSIFMDGDCIPFEGFIADHVSFAEPDVILAGPRILASPLFTQALESKTETCISRSLPYWLLKWGARSVNRISPLIKLPDGDWRKKNPKNWQLVRGCNFSVETRHALAVGGFEESLYGWGPDDSDIAVRLMNYGLSVKSLRFAAPVLHLWHKEEDRQHLKKNLTYLETALRENRIRAIKGIGAV